MEDTLTKEGGRFHLDATEEEEMLQVWKADPIRFFLRVDVQCSNPQNGPSRFLTLCADKQIKERCAAAVADEHGYKYATFTHAFEKNPGGEENVKDTYKLNCTLGFKNYQEEHDGLSCTGGLCKGGRCGIEIKLKKKRSVRD